MSSVVVFSPSRYSLYTITVTELLRHQNVEVKAVIVRKLVNPGRFVSEFRRDGARLIKKIWKKLVLRERAYSEQTFETMASFMRVEGIRFKTVDVLTREYDIPIQYCRDLNDPEVVETLRRLKPDLVIFTGGGLIRKEVLASAGAGVVNCHMGMLPRYRGMDVVEWPILEGDFERIGMTVHFMDEGVDTGDILRTKRVDYVLGDTIKQIRDRFEPLMCREIVSICADFLAGKVKRQPQKRGAGKQYFVMHPRLIRLAGQKLKSKSD
jgi:folate-dependent phosphoribosylglycinamide formyltransferase PurN